MENQTKEIRRLQNCINDLVSLLALPAICNGRDASNIIGALLNVLPGMLRLEFVYARLNVPAGVPPVERLRVAERRETTPQPQEVGRALEPWLTPDTPTSACVAPNPVGEGEATIARVWLGLEKEMGVVVAASRQADFPTEKELIARAIHRLSDRREQSFVKLNCAAIPTGLPESELFGHEKGAFTGAIAQRAGRFELAHRGTLFPIRVPPLRERTEDIPLLVRHF